MSRGVPHSDETRAAVLAALLEGQSVNEVARTYQVGRATVRAWRDAEGIGASSPPVRPQKREEIGELVAEYLRESLITLRVQQQHFRDKAWLGKQNAADLAVLHGVSLDKAVRLLEALQPDERGEQADSGSPPAGG